MKAVKFVFLSLILPVLLSSCDSKIPGEVKNHKYNESYSGSNTDRVAFPIGGMGAGMFCLEGTGAISEMSVRNHPDVFNEPCMFAAICLKGIKNGAKVLEGQVPEWKRFGPPNTGNGSDGASWGLPRFENAKFLARFPFAYIDLEDKELPLEVKIKGWSPFIPDDADNSSLPTGAIEYSFKNTGSSELEAVFSYNSKNFMRQAAVRGAPVAGGVRRPPSNTSIKAIPNGFVLSQEGPAEAPSDQGDFAIFTNEPGTVVDYCWFRGGWFDGLTMAWKTISNCEVKSNPPIDLGAPGASLYVPFKLKRGETKVIRVMMAWFVPNSIIRSGRDPEPVPEAPCCEANYKPWYTSKFKDIQGVVNFWGKTYDDLLGKSEKFRDSFYASTLPPEVIEAVAANLTILKSPTVLRQADGRLWGWEGCSDNSGCCAGSTSGIMHRLFLIYSHNWNGHSEKPSSLSIKMLQVIRSFVPHYQSVPSTTNLLQHLTGSWAEL